MIGVHDQDVIQTFLHGGASLAGEAEEDLFGGHSATLEGLVEAAADGGVAEVAGLMLASVRQLPW
jgi:hypothetical protein